ncbi:MAG TPA: hypothetical protein VMH91_00980 [Candidatus Paceibacterota bacterium]|nr:hypothetical protein [Candidatus Paceibacterota bacterium]
MSWLGSWFLTIGAAALVLAGVVFDFLIQHVIIDFGGTLNTLGALNAITVGWTVFRDVANIVIIGMFTFIAIATILGNTEYGYRKMLSRVLIVAILINFSLLFSKIIIDVGNVTAYQIYGAVANSSQFSQNTQGSGGSQQFDIANAFLQPMGITSVWNTQGLTDQFAQTTGSGFQAFAYGLVGGLLLLALAVVLFYGCFLIASRAVLLIILMVTASIAFASHLVPKLSESQYGWSGWWSSLINASLFAPLLMVFLAISMLILKGASGVVIGQNSQNGAIGTAVFTALSAPGQSVTSNGWTVIMLYIFGVGLLFISFRISSSFAASIGGLNLAQAALSTPLAAANRYLVAPGLRNLPWIGGRGAAARAQTLGKNVEDEAKVQAALEPGEQNLSKLTSLLRQKNRAESRAKSTFDVANTGIGQTIAKGIKVPAPLIEKTKTNFADSSKKTAEEAAKAATEVAVSKKDAEGVAREEVEKNYAVKTQELKDKRASDAKLVEQVRTIADTAKKNEGLDEKMKAARQNEEKVRTEAVAEKEKIAGRKDVDGAARSRLFEEQDQRIKEAREQVENVQSRINVIERQAGFTEATSKLAKSETDLKDHYQQIDKEVRERGQEILRASGENAQVVGANLTQNWLQRTLNVPADSVVAKKARSFTKKKVGTKGIKERVTAEREALQDAGESDDETPSTPEGSATH